MAARFNVALPEPGEAMVAGENVAVTPVGMPDTVSATADVSPVVAVFTVAVLVWPCETVAA